MPLESLALLDVGERSSRARPADDGPRLAVVHRDEDGPYRLQLFVHAGEELLARSPLVKAVRERLRLSTCHTLGDFLVRGERLEVVGIAREVLDQIEQLSPAMRAPELLEIDIPESEIRLDGRSVPLDDESETLQALKIDAQVRLDRLAESCYEGDEAPASPGVSPSPASSSR
jgi:hypothetical protein